MKKLILSLVVILPLFMLFSVNNVFSQDCCDDCTWWQAEYDSLLAVKAALSEQLNALNADISDLKLKSSQLDKDLVKAEEDYNYWKNCSKTKKEEKIPEGKEGQYTVVKGDYLIKIASKKEIYDNPKMWPILWEANEKGVISAPPKVATNIPNPNLIYPGQVLRVPALTADLKKKAEETANKYKSKRKKKSILK